jgi:phosphoglycerol transferase
MTITTIISFGLLVLGLLVFLRSGQCRRFPDAVFFLGTLASVWLLTVYLAADHFTGEGIDSTVVFHLRYGLRGAGFRDYRGLILLCAASLIFAPLILGGLCFWKRDRPRRPGLIALAHLLALGSLGTNPATANLVKLATPPTPQAADFLRHYRPPALTAVSEAHPNFVFIYAESFERTYFDEKIFPGLITQLRRLETQGTSFTNIRSAESTGFTMGGLVASLCGIPLFTPSHGNSMSGMDAFLPRAVGLSNLLHDEGYYLSFMEGAFLQFAGKGKFLASHQFEEMAGFETLQARLPDKTYVSNWGLFDDTLFDLAYERFLELSAQKNRFGLFLLTLDTHHPEGHLSRTVAATAYGDGRNPMLNAVAAADRLIGSFVRRIQDSPQGKNTVIVIASDHLALMNAAHWQLERGQRRNLFLVLDPRDPLPRQVARQGSTLDTGTTLLPFLGYRGSIGLGRDLLDPAVPDGEIAHIQNSQTLLSWRGELEKFWWFPRFRKAFSFREDMAEVTIDGRHFSAPVLVQLGAQDRTVLRFEFDAVWDVRLAQQAERLERGSNYLLVAARKDAQELLPARAAGDSPWVLIVGKAGLGHVALPCANGATFTKREIDELLARWR